ncbi:MAG: hypothetical protein OXI63_08525 [Candidatus Poribacteria bacterium]|nr:hypothetical protein [Candidatus Poribacteria bacterium]
MRPNDVKELLDALIAELELPLRASNSGPELVSEKSDGLTQERINKIVKQWLNGDLLSHCISVGRSVSEQDKATTHLASETHRAPEVKEVLKSLIEEQTLPLTVVDNGFRLEVLVDKAVDYRCDDMVKLETLLAKEGLNVPVRHRGFGLWQAEDSGDLQFSQFETLANRLAAALEGHGLQVKLLHRGFELHKNETDEVDIAEAKELTYRLEIMVGIRYVQGDYRYSNDVENPEVHWKSAGVNTALPF